MKKTLDTATITNELKGASLFFSQKPVNALAAKKKEARPVVSEKKQTPSAPSTSIQTPAKKRNKGVNDVVSDVNVDVVTSITQDINLRTWKDLIENSEARNTSFRMSEKEREKAEDAVRTLKRTYKIKTSMNELARLGLLLLLHDFDKRKKKSIVVEVKTS